MNAKHLFVLGIGSLLCLSVGAQVVDFDKTFGGNEAEDGIRLLETQDHGLLLIGWTETETSGLADFYIVKTDSVGEEEWSVTHGGFNNEIPIDGVELEDGSFVIIGYTGSFTSSPSRDVYLVKLNKDGDILWTKSIGGNQTDEGTSIRQTSDGGFILTALTESFGAGDRDAWLIKTDSVGDTLWTKTFGGPELDDAWDIEITADGGYIFTGGTHSFASGTDDDMWLVKTDALGNQEWMSTLGETDRIDWGWDVEVVSDGYVAVGVYNADPTQPDYLTGDAFFVKTDLQGNMLWNKSIASNDRSEGNGIAVTSDGGFVLCGFRIDPTGSIPYVFWVSRADDDGDILWTQEFGTSGQLSEAQDVIQRSSGHYAALGYTGLSQTEPGDMYLVHIIDTNYFNPADTIDSTTNIVTVTANKGDISIYPNPSSGHSTLRWNEEKIEVAAITVRSVSGQLVESQVVLEKQNMHSVQLNKPGVYIIELLDGQGAVLETRRWLVSP